jgi:hypothetical protein
MVAYNVHMPLVSTDRAAREAVSLLCSLCRTTLAYLVVLATHKIGIPMIEINYSDQRRAAEATVQNCIGIQAIYCVMCYCTAAALAQRAQH